MFLPMDRTETAKIRLFVEHPLGAGQSVPLDRAQAHYLFGVMRLSVGAHVLLFNGTEGEWVAEVYEVRKRDGRLRVLDQKQQQRDPPDVWLMFAPIKKARTDFIVEKAVEMGVKRILPVQTEFTNAGRIQRDRLQAHAIEAAEQCGATFVPHVEEMQRLDRLMAKWTRDRQILFCDESYSGDAPNIPALNGPWVVLVGPEGGFSASERNRLASMDTAHAVSLGPRILRAETAVVAALALWQVACGDWR